MTTEIKTIVVGGDIVDLSTLPALTIGHKRALFRDYGIDLNKLAQLNPDDEFKFVVFLVRLMRPETTEEDVEAITLSGVADVLVGLAQPRE